MNLLWGGVKRDPHGCQIVFSTFSVAVTGDLILNQVPSKTPTKVAEVACQGGVAGVCSLEEP